MENRTFIPFTTLTSRRRRFLFILSPLKLHIFILINAFFTVFCFFFLSAQLIFYLPPFFQITYRHFQIYGFIQFQNKLIHSMWTLEHFVTFHFLVIVLVSSFILLSLYTFCLCPQFEYCLQEEVKENLDMFLKCHSSQKLRLKLAFCIRLHTHTHT